MSSQPPEVPRPIVVRRYLIIMATQVAMAVVGIAFASFAMNLEGQVSHILPVLISIAVFLAIPETFRLEPWLDRMLMRRR